MSESTANFSEPVSTIAAKHNVNISVKAALSGAHIGQTANVRGWVRTRRDSKAGISFIQLSDGSCFGTFQIVVPNTLANYTSEVLRLTAGAAFEATGLIVASQGGGQSCEMQAESILVHGFVADPETYPIQPKAHSMEFLREVAHLRPRTNTFGAVARIRNCLAQAVHRYYHERDFF